jgi:hypothetical protein
MYLGGILVEFPQLSICIAPEWSAKRLRGLLESSSFVSARGWCKDWLRLPALLPPIPSQTPYLPIQKSSYDMG